MAIDVIITIDGPAGTGKSTVAHRLANRLGLDFLDTGAMYRAVALLAFENAIDTADGDGLAAATREADLHFDWSADPPRIMLGERDVTGRIREPEITAIVSVVAGQPEVRTVLVEKQRRIAAAHPRLVTEGRDQGSVVFPDAAVRFYLDADVHVRADRRARQMIEAGRSVDPTRIARDIVERDRLDASRSDGPLVRPVGAIEVDTGDCTVDEVVARLEGITRERLGEAELAS